MQTSLLFFFFFKKKTMMNFSFDRFDYDKIRQLPYGNDANKLAIHSKTRRLTGKTLVKENIKREAHRLQINIPNINLMVNRIWNHHLTPTQQEEFTTLANNANIINQSAAHDDFLNRMIQINIHQVTNNPFEDALFNGTNKFHDDGLESLILTSGSSFFM
jgi:hypothetical protein